MINNRRSFICGIKGFNLSNKEIKFLKKFKPWGVILFKRNIKTINQTKTLTDKIKRIFNDKYYPILIDEEGGRVSRLNKFIDNSIFSGNYFGNLFHKNKSKFYEYNYVYTKQISYLLYLLGININTVPILDIRRKKSNNVIGDRSYSSNKRIISEVGNSVIKNFHASKIATVIKHLPGHGLSKVDSHFRLPRINKTYSYLKKNDFAVFKNKSSIFAMTGHLLFDKIDPDNCSTHSKKIIKIIRNEIGFKKILISDDISMKALKYSVSKNTRMAFTAGCNIVLHCNGNFKEMNEVAKNSPLISKFVVDKTSQFRKIIS